jgi:hypothetical protein
VNYYFIAKLYDIRILSSLSRGKKIDEKARISNGQMNFKRIFDNEVFKDSIGRLEANAFENSTYVYEVGEYSDLKKVFDIEYPQHIYLNYLMRKIQVFLTSLWLVKDNSVNLELGFLQIYPDDRPIQGTIHSNSIASSPNNCYGEYAETTFTSDELELAIKYFNILLEEDSDLKENGDRLPSRNPLAKGSARIGRALYFLFLARDESVLPLKIMSYCSVLECLFTSDSSEVTHKVSERFARFMGETYDERQRYFKLAKDLYKIRSKAVHGQVVKDTPETMRGFLKDIDSAVRVIFSEYFTDVEGYEVFEYNNDDYEKWFTELILK